MNTDVLTASAGALLISLSMAGCAAAPPLPETAGYGPNPTLPEPKKQTLPEVKIAPTKPWAEGEKPVAGDGLEVNAFAAGLDHPRWLYVLPNGDVLVAETNGPERPDDRKGLRGMMMKKAQSKAGAAVPSANRITLLRDADHDGVAEVKQVFLANLNSPFGMVLVGDQLYVANTDAIVRYPYRQGAMQIAESGSRVAELPAGTLNHHWTKNVLASRDGSKLYATVGSNSNVAENGIEKEDRRAAILEIDPRTGSSRVFASGLRNPNGLAWQPQTGALWTAVNERDEIGDDLVPDYITSVRDGGFYGWPYTYYGRHVDERVEAQRPDLVDQAIKPDYAVGSHTASLGLAFYDGALFPEEYRGGAFVGQHGSWNRSRPSGYQVLFVPFRNGQPNGMPKPVLTGFLNDKDEARGRPVGVAIDRQGALLVADDVGNRIWRVVPSGGPSRGER